MIKGKQKILDKISKIDIEIGYKELEKKQYLLELKKFKEEDTVKIGFKTD